MKQLLTLCLAFLGITSTFAQAPNPINWTAVYKSISASEGEIVITGTLEKGWHTYSQRPTDAGPIPTSFTFTPSKFYKTDGKTTEANAHEEFVKAFDAKIFVFNEKAEFRQKIKLSGKAGFMVAIKIDYMCCNDMMCLPPKTVDLQVKVQ